MSLLSNFKAKVCRLTSSRVSLFAVIALVGLVFDLGPAHAADDVVPGEYIVKMKGRPSSQRSANFVGKIANKANLKATFGKLNLHHLALKPGQDAAAFLDEIRADEDVDYIEPNYVLRRIDSIEEDNRVFSMEESVAMAAENSAYGYSQNGADVKVTQTWTSMSTSSQEIPVVAVIDTGIDYNHPVFVNSGALWRNPGEIPGNGIDDDGNGYVDDVFGWNFVGRNGLPFDDDKHGTHVAGIVLGVTQNIFASPIAAAKIRIMPLKFLNASGSGATSDAIQAVYYAVNNGASVINNSWGGSNYSQALHDAMNFAYQHHVVIVSAAGNYASDNDSAPLFPASYPVPSNISVAATNDFDNLASFSNYGKNTVRMSAPGVAIWSTVPGGGSKYLSGTSMAAPFVSGLAALALREAPRLSGYQVANLIVNTGQSFTELWNRTISGNRADSLQSLISAKTQVNVDPIQPEYVAAAVGRSPASETVPKAGCGSVGLVGGAGAWKSPQDPPPQSLLFALALSLVPFIVWNVLRIRAKVNEEASGKNRRRFERFAMNSEIKVRVGDRELIGQMNTISVGGASFKADALLERGGIVTLQIASPDGEEQVQVEGCIVWNEANQSYGVQFQDAKDEAISSIQGWTTNLSKAN